MTKETKQVSVESLNTRDLLLLVQLIEQHGGLDLEDEDYQSKLETIHEEYTTHKVFLLSHNELNQNNLEISSKDLSKIITSIFQLHSDKNLIQICEFYHQKRIEEIESELQSLQTEFANTRKTTAV